jgi:hypothetical protein
VIPQEIGGLVNLELQAHNRRKNGAPEWRSCLAGRLAWPGLISLRLSLLLLLDVASSISFCSWKMDPSSLDQSHGIQFSKVQSLFNAPVVSSVADDARSFWLVASFSRSRIRLNEDSVSKILHSTLGGIPLSFSVLELEDRLFKFAVFDRRVGLHIYAMKFFACDSFKVFFHLWNHSGLASARISRTLDQGPRYEWQPVKSPKRSSKVAGSHSFADAVRVGMQAPNSVFFRLDFGSVPDSAFGSTVRPCSLDHHDPSITDHSRQGISNVPLTGANTIPLLKVPDQRFSRVNCSRCFSNFHSRPNCRSPVRCSACFRYGHIADSCRYPARFPGL